MAYYTIHVAPGLGAKDYQRACRLGPPSVGARSGPATLLKRAGFSAIQEVDVTDAFGETCSRLVAARDRYAAELRVAEGEEMFCEEQEKKNNLAEGIETGLLRRSLLIGTKRSRRASPNRERQ